MSARRALAAALLALALFPVPRAARASTEEFSTFDVARPEEDDESLLDHWLTRTPRDWQGEWERAPKAIRTAQGCLTSGQWFIDTQGKLETPMGKRARLGVEYDERQSDLVSYQFLDFLFIYPQPVGTFSVRFRPLYDKSRQDLGLAWGVGADTSRASLLATFTLEDVFNDLWAWRQTRVGNASEGYQVHPWEPALRFTARGKRWRLAADGKWLTPSRKRIANFMGNWYDAQRELWGARAGVTFGVDALGLSWEGTGESKQARGSEEPVPDPAAAVPWSPADSATFVAGDRGVQRRLWSGGLTTRREFGGRFGAEVGWLYQQRCQTWNPPLGPGRFDAADRLVHGELSWRARPWLTTRFGGMFDRITVAREGTPGVFSYGTRNESRAYFGLAAKFGNVSVYGVEGIELDPEPYDVWLVHDKGFLGLQATF